MHSEKGSNPSIHVLDQPNGVFRENIQKWSGFLPLISSEIKIRKSHFRRLFPWLLYFSLYPKLVSSNNGNTDLGGFGSVSSQQQPRFITAVWYNVFITADTVPVDPALHFISLSPGEKFTRKETDLELLICILAFRNIMGTLMSRKSSFLSISKVSHLYKM